MNKKVLLTATVLGATMALSSAAMAETVGVSMPTKDLQRWNQDGDNMQKELEAAGYTVDLQYASNDVQTQLSQVENMISQGDDVLVIAAIEGSSLGEALDMAKENDIPVIAYDRLLMDSDAVSYYATFDNYKVGTVQGQYIVDTLDLENADGPFNLEITAGDPGDNNAGFFYQGAMDVLQPYIDSGKLVEGALQSIGLDREWVDKMLKQRHLKVKDVFLMTGESSGKAVIIPFSATSKQGREDIYEIIDQILEDTV